MPRKPPILDFSEFDPEKITADIEEIRRYNPQRFEMEQLSAVCYEDRETKTCVAYKDVTADEFWVRGHMPGIPLMPGVLMCEAAAQLASYCTMKWKLIDVEMVGLRRTRGSPVSWHRPSRRPDDHYGAAVEGAACNAHVRVSGLCGPRDGIRGRPQGNPLAGFGVEGRTARLRSAGSAEGGIRMSPGGGFS